MLHRYLRIVAATTIALGAASMIWPALQWLSYVLLFTGVALFLIEIRGIVRDVTRIFSRLPFRGPILWNFQGFLGSYRKRGEAAYVTVFQISGENISRHSVELLEAKIYSNISGKQIDVTFKTNEGYTEAKNLNPVPPGARFHAHALFYDANSKGPDEREGVPEDLFLEDWGDFHFIFKTPKRTDRKRFSNKVIVEEIAKVKPSPVAVRRISRKDLSISRKDLSISPQDQISFIKFNPSTYEITDVGGNVIYWDDRGIGDYVIGFYPPLDKNDLICTPIGETPRDFEIVSFTPDNVHIKFKTDPQNVHLRFGR